MGSRIQYYSAHAYIMAIELELASCNFQNSEKRSFPVFPLISHVYKYSFFAFFDLQVLCKPPAVVFLQLDPSFDLSSTAHAQFRFSLF